MTSIARLNPPNDPPAIARQNWLKAHTLWLGIFLLAILVRLWGVNALDVSIDEGHSFLMATGNGDIVTRLQQDTNPPLYFLILKAWLWAFGSTILQMRLLSAICGLAVLVMLGLLASACGAARRTITWVLLLGALTPLQIHYSQVARGYTLALLLFTLGLYTFLRATKAHEMPARPRTAWWGFHALFVALGAYANNLLVPLCAGYLISALAMRAPKRQWLSMALTYGIAGLVSLPALMLAMHQQKTSGGMEWIRGFWLATPPSLAMFKSTVILTFGGDMPGYLLSLPLPKPLQWASLAILAMAFAAFFWPASKASGPTRNPLGSNASFILVFALWPLLFLWAYSTCFKPIYLVGRYDLFAQPALLLLMAAGLTRLQTAVTPRWPAVTLAAGVLVILAAGVGCRWKAAAEVQRFRPEDRANYLAKELQPRDVIVSTGLEAAPAMYHLHQQHIDAPLISFPRETMSHLGWFISNEQILARKNDWTADAAALLQDVQPDQRIWVLMDSEIWSPNPNFASPIRLQFFLDFMAVARANGWNPEEIDPQHQGDRIGLRILSLIHTPTPPSPTSIDAPLTLRN